MAAVEEQDKGKAAGLKTPRPSAPLDLKEFLDGLIGDG